MLVLHLHRGLVEETSAPRASTEADDLLVFDGEMIVVGDLIAFIDDLLGIDDNLLAVSNRKNFCCTVWRAAMVDEPSEIAFHGRINDYVVVNPAVSIQLSATVYKRPSHNTHKR